MTEINLHYKYQPIVDLDTLDIVRQEALLRVDGVSDIEAFVGEFERQGSVIEIDLHAVTSALEQIQANRGESPVPIAINVSALSLVNPCFQHEVLSHLQQARPSSALSFEITETWPISHMERARNFVQRLKQYGCSVGLDDLGDGYSRLGLVQHLHLNYLKLSSKLTTRVMHSVSAQEAVREAIRFAADHRIPIVAEHIDNEAQLAWLRKEGITHGQGWLFAKPDDLITSAEDFSADLRSRLGQPNEKGPCSARASPDCWLRELA